MTPSNLTLSVRGMTLSLISRINVGFSFSNNNDNNNDNSDHLLEWLEGLLILFI